MVTLNGRRMLEGDIVYDVLKGAGRVVDDGGGVLNVRVSFGENDIMQFSQEGKFQGHQRLYWRPPYLIQPRGPKDDAYEHTIALSRIIYEYFQSFETKQSGSK